MQTSRSVIRANESTMKYIAVLLIFISFEFTVNSLADQGNPPVVDSNDQISPTPTKKSITSVMAGHLTAFATNPIGHIGWHLTHPLSAWTTNPMSHDDMDMDNSGTHSSSTSGGIMSYVPGWSYVSGAASGIANGVSSVFGGTKPNEDGSWDIAVKRNRLAATV